MKNNIKEYKSGLKKLMKKAGLKYKSTSTEPLPDNVVELQNELGWFHNDPCIINRDVVINGNVVLQKGDKGKVYYPYNKDKIVCIFWRIHRSIKLHVLDISHYKPKKENL